MKDAMKEFLLFAGFVLAAASASHAAVQGREVAYSANGTTLKGYIAYDDAAKGKHPGILVVHEWWGHNEYARPRARMLAERGYTALALDMYGDGKQAHHPDDAGKFANEVSQNAALARARFEAALELVKKEKTVDAANIGTQQPAEQGKVKARVASFTGEDDPMIPATQVAAFRQEMEKAGVNYKVVTYPSAKHAFTNPAADEYGKKFNLPLAYNAAADKASWDEGLAFLAVAFKAK